MAQGLARAKTGNQPGTMDQGPGISQGRGQGPATSQGQGPAIRDYPDRGQEWKR